MRLFIKVGIVIVAIGCVIVLSAFGISKYSIERSLIYSEFDFKKNNGDYFSKPFNLTEGEFIKVSWDSNKTAIKIAFKVGDNYTLIQKENSTKNDFQYTVKNSGEYFLVAKTNSTLRVGISIIITSYPFADIVFPLIISGLGIVGVGTVLVILGFYRTKVHY